MESTSIPKPDPRRNVVEDIRALIRDKDGRYPIEAYRFIYEALAHALQTIGRERHVTGRELLEAARELALLRCGPLAKMVFHSWNVRRTEDFGQLVFNLVDAGLMSKTATDSKDDFKDGFDFEKAFSLETYFNSQIPHP